MDSKELMLVLMNLLPGQSVTLLGAKWDRIGPKWFDVTFPEETEPQKVMAVHMTIEFAIGVLLEKQQ